MVLIFLLLTRSVPLLAIAPESAINDTSLNQITVAGAMPEWRASDLDTLVALQPVLRDGKRHFVRTEAVRKRLEEEDRELTEQYAASWREALKAEPLDKLTADRMSERFEKLRRDLDERRITPGQFASTGIGGSIAALVVGSLQPGTINLKDGEARLWTVDTTKFKEMDNLVAVAEELGRRYPVIPKSNTVTDHSLAAHSATTLDVQKWAKCANLTVFARRSGAVLLLATHGFDAEGRMLVFARHTVSANASHSGEEWPDLESGPLTMTPNLREWVDFATIRPSLWYHDGVTAPRSSLDQAVAEMLLAHWAKDGVQTVAGWVPTSTINMFLKHRQRADTISAALWNDLRKTLVVAHDKERKLVLIRPRFVLAGERARMEPSVWATFASGKFTFARWGAALAASPVGIEWNAVTQSVQRTLQAMDPRVPAWTGLTFAAAKSEPWLRVFAWMHPFPYADGTPATRQAIWYIASGDVRTPLAYDGEVGKVEAFKDIHFAYRMSSYWTAEDWKSRARHSPIESDFEVGSIETHEARYRVQAIPNMVFGASVHDLGVGTGVIKRMRWEFEQAMPVLAHDQGADKRLQR